MREKILFYATAFFLASIPWQTRFIFRQGEVGGYASEYLTLSLYAADILAVFLVAAFLYAHAPKRKKSEIGRKKAAAAASWAAALFLWTFFSAWWAADRLLAIQHSFWIFLALAAVWILRMAPKRKQAVFFFLGSLTLSAWLGIWQFVSQQSFSNKWLGLSGHDPLLGGSSVVEIFSAEGSLARFLRAYGGFDHPNIFGTYMAVGILLLLRLWVESGNGKEKILLGVALLSMSGGFFMSLSRSAWIGLLLGLVIFAAGELYGKFSAKKDFFAAARGIFGPLALVLGMFALLWLFYPAQVSTRSAAAGRLEEKSLSERASYLAQGKELAKENFFGGTGAGNYVTVLQRKYPEVPSWQMQPVHSVPVLVWAELGIVGLFLLAAMFFSLCRAALFGKTAPLALWAVLAGAFILDHWLWSLHSGLMLVGLIGGLSGAAGKKTVGRQTF